MRDRGENPQGRRSQLKAVGLAAGLGCSVVAGLIIFIVGGVFLDRWLDSTPLFTLLGVLLGILAAGGQLYRLARVGR